MIALGKKITLILAMIFMCGYMQAAAHSPARADGGGVLAQAADDEPTDPPAEPTDPPAEPTDPPADPDEPTTDPDEDPTIPETYGDDDADTIPPVTPLDD